MSTAQHYSVDLTTRPYDRGRKSTRRNRWLTTTALGAAGLLALAGAPATAQVALPSGGTVVAGTVTIGTPTADSLTITQDSARGVINWSSFNVGAGGTVNFVQPDAKAITLNRDMSGQLSTIGGNINANGQVWLLNPNGMLVNSTGNISVGAFLGTTHAMATSDTDFVNGATSVIFGNAATGSATVTNLGHITAADGGYAILAGRLVNNGDGTLGNGVITANLGTVVLGGVPNFTISLDGQTGGLLSFAVGSGEFSGLTAPAVNHRGEINAIGGKVIMTARAMNDIVGSVVNVAGNVNAATAIRDGSGNIILAGTAPGEITVDGGVNGVVKIADEADGVAGGVLNVNSDTNIAAGSISVTGDTVEIGTTGSALLLASGIGANAPSAGSITINGNSLTAGAQSHLQAMAFGGDGKTGGTVSIAASGASSQVTIAGFVEASVGSDLLAGFEGQGGTNGTGGSIEVSGDSVTLASGAPGGRLIANAGLAGGTGGLVKVAGDSITINGSGLSDFVAPAISAGGAAAAGTVMIGGDVSGATILGRALPMTVNIGADAAIYTEVFGSSGNGGTISIWSDPSAITASTTVLGRVSSRSALGAGNGGTIEIGGRSLSIMNEARIEVGADTVGGNIRLIGDSILVDTFTSSLETPRGLLAAGTLGGGNIAIGGGLGGQLLAAQPLPTSVVIGGTTRLNVNAGSGNAGQVTIWSDPTNASGQTSFSGLLGAGSFNGGMGGSVEIGGYNIVTAGGFIAAHGVTTGAGCTSMQLCAGGTINISGTNIGLGGNIILDASGYGLGGTVDIVGTSTVDVAAGTDLFAESVPGAGGTGGLIRIAGDAISIGGPGEVPNTDIVAGGDTAGGTVLIGGGIDGTTLLGRSLSTSVTIGADAAISADSYNASNGGMIGVWSTRGNSSASTTVLGKLYARSGLQGGNGGLIELGGYSVAVADNARLDTTASALGGNVRLLGDRITVDTHESTETNPVGIFAWGIQGGGTIHVGGGFGGTLIGSQALPTFVDIGGTSRFNANAIETGIGGNITIWTDLFNSGAVLVLGGSLAVDSNDFAGSIDVGAADVRLRTLSASASGDGGSIELFNSGYGYGYSSSGLGGPVSLLAGSGASIDIDGEFETLGGDFTINAGDDSYISFAGFLGTNGGAFAVNAGARSYVDNYGAINAFLDATGNSIAFNLGADSEIYNDGTITTGQNGITLAGGDGAEIYNYGAIESNGGAITLTVGAGRLVDFGEGSFVVGGINNYNSGSITTGGGNLVMVAGAGGYIDNYGYLDADVGDVELTADAITVAAGSVLSLMQDSSGTPINIFGSDIRLNADSIDIAGQVLATNSITVAPRTISRAINMGGFDDVADSLSLTDLELDNIDAPTTVIGRADGTGAINIFVTPESCEIECGSFEDPPSSILIQSPGTGGSITVHGTGEIGDLESVRLVAGSNITLAQGFSLLVPGKLELVSGGSFTNLAGTGALTTAGDGQWLIYSADPALNNFGGLLSGQKALWGQAFSTIAANGLAHSGNLYAFGLAPTVTVAALNRSKTYGDTLGLASPVLGTDFSVSGLIDAAKFGGVFVQDSLSGAPTLDSSGAAATANAGSYAITASAGTFAAGSGYNLVFQAGSLTVDPRQLTASLTGAVTKVYDATTSATLAAGNYSLAGFVNGDGATVGQTSGSFASPNVGSNLLVTASLSPTSFVANSGTSLSNYLLPTLASGAIGSITPATLTYVANPVTRPQNMANPALSGSVTGFVGGETQATATTGTLAFTTAATIDSPAGAYAINGGGLTAANYVFTQAAGNATALQVSALTQPAQQITTTVIQQVTTSATTTPTPTPTPIATPTPPPTSPTTGSLTGTATGATGGTSGNLPPPPPPPPPPQPPASGSTGGSTPPPPGPPVESTPPSPVGDEAPPTPSDSADQGDPVLAEAETPEEEQDEPTSEKRQLASTTVVVPGVNVEVPTPPRSTDVPGAEQSFSGSGNPAQW